jgi:hypothetical protein
MMETTLHLSSPNRGDSSATEYATYYQSAPVHRRICPSTRTFPIMRVFALMVLVSTTVQSRGAANDASSAKANRPVITSSATATAREGESFAHRVVSTGSRAIYKAQNLPIEFSINCVTGEITGLPLSPRTVTFTILAMNEAGTHSQPVTVTITPTSAAR